MAGYAMIADWVYEALRNHPKCAEFPEQCKAEVKYNDASHKFFMDIMKDGKKQYKKEVKLFRDRVKRKEWKKLYPINNHDFNYENIITNNYNPFKLGISNKPTVDNLIDGTGKLSNLMEVMLESPLPDKNSISGNTDITQSPVFKDRIKDLKNKYNKMPLPYPSFKKDYPESKYPTKGQHSSSYFIKTGTCKTKINNEYDCRRKGFRWVKNKKNFKKLGKFFSKVSRSKDKQPKKIKNGNCFKPRFSYINNSAKGFQNFKGLGPAFYNDVMSMTPEKLGAIMSGYTVDGTGMVPCPEEFTNFNNNINIKNRNYSILSMILIIIILFILSKIMYN